MTFDPAIDEIRLIRHQISEESHHDPKRLIEHYIEMEKELRISGDFRFADQLVSTNEAPAEAENG
jgi:hypothetical protein